MSYADPREAGYIASANQPHAAALASDYAALGAQLERRGVRIDDITRAVANFKVAIPSWGVGTGGTRFGRFPGVGEPRNVFEKLIERARGIFFGKTFEFEDVFPAVFTFFGFVVNVFLVVEVFDDAVEEFRDGERTRGIGVEVYSAPNRSVWITLCTVIEVEG